MRADAGSTPETSSDHKTATIGLGSLVRSPGESTAIRGPAVSTRNSGLRVRLVAGKVLHAGGNPIHAVREGRARRPHRPRRIRSDREEPRPVVTVDENPQARSVDPICVCVREQQVRRRAAEQRAGGGVGDLQSRARPCRPRTWSRLTAVLPAQSASRAARRWLPSASGPVQPAAPSSPAFRATGTASTVSLERLGIDGLAVAGTASRSRRRAALARAVGGDAMVRAGGLASALNATAAEDSLPAVSRTCASTWFGAFDEPRSEVETWRPPRSCARRRPCGRRR